MAKTRKSERLTLKEKKFADKYIETGNATEAALAVYDTKDRRNASKIGSYKLSKPEVIQRIEFELAKVGINKRTQVEIARQLLTSNDLRVKFQTWVEVNKMLDVYPAGKLRVGMLDNIEEVLIDK